MWEFNVSLLSKIGIFILASMIVFITFFYLVKVICRKCCAEGKHYTTLYHDEDVENIIDEKKGIINQNILNPSIDKVKLEKALYAGSDRS